MTAKPSSTRLHCGADNPFENHCSLDEVLYRLLFDSHFCRTFTSGKWADLPIRPSDYDHLMSVDTDELGKMATLVRRDVLSGAGSGNLLRSFPRTFMTLATAGRAPEDIVDRFVASEDFRESRELPFAGRGLSIEEAFYNFVAGDPELVMSWHGQHPWMLHEFLSAIFAILATSPEPNFEIRTPTVRQNHACRYALVTYSAAFICAIRNVEVREPKGDERIFLYAAANQALIRGPISTTAAAILIREHRSGSSASYHNDGLINKDAERWEVHFAKLGLI